MTSGFFHASAVASGRRPLPLAPRCGQCGLHARCKSPKMPVNGLGRRRILVVGEGPGRQEDDQGLPFVGPTGQKLAHAMQRCGVDLRRDCWLTNAVICRPSDAAGHNRPPTDAEVDCCAPNLMAALDDLAPVSVLLLGARAVRAVLGRLWREDVGPVSRWVGFRIPCKSPNAWIHPTYHPAYVLCEENGVLDKEFNDHVRAACAARDRPWPGAPEDLRGSVRVVIDPDEAADRVDALAAGGGPLSVDYETTTLKPDGPHARIVSCAVSDGAQAVSYPWAGRAVAATSELLRSRVPKVGQNIAFEERWTLKHLGHPVRNWLWDAMLAAHVLDNRPGICSIKFQSFVRLGQESYDDRVGPLLRSAKGAGCNAPNKVGEIDLRSLLLYGGLDALVEYRVAEQQMRELGFAL